MKRGTPEHPKTLDMAERLSSYLPQQGLTAPLDFCETIAVGVIEKLAHFTARYATAGDIGKHSNARIAKALGWSWDSDWLVNSLIESRWLDTTPGRLYVHDWHEHSDEFADRWLADEGLLYANGLPPRNKPRKYSKASRMSPEELERTRAARGTPAVRTLPEPISESKPKPESKPISTSSVAARPRSARVTHAVEFESWYGSYPRHVGKQDAAAAYGRAIVKLIPRHPSREIAVEWLLTVTTAFAASPAGNAGDYTPYPATWLNQGRYDDDPNEWNRREGDNGSAKTPWTPPKIGAK